MTFSGASLPTPAKCQISLLQSCRTH